MKIIILAMVLLVTAPNALAGSVSTLNTPNFNITITTNCKEGEVACNDVSYKGISKKTSKAITLKGKTLHTLCKDGSPCRFLGYEFVAGITTYRVLEDGSLTVTQNGRSLIQERGEWR